MALQRSRSSTLNGLTSLAYLGVLPNSPNNFIIKQGAPTTNDYRNVYVGDFWLDNSSMYLSPSVPPTAANLWVLVSVVNHAATWINIGGTVLSVSGGNNITITGTATNPIVNVSGTTNHSVLLGNATGSINSLVNGTTGQILTAQTGLDPIWAAAPSTGVTSVPTDSGTATPSAGVLNILSGRSTGTNISTTGSGNTVTVRWGNEVVVGDQASLVGSTSVDAVTGDVTITQGNINMANTNSAGTTGVIKLGGDRFIHNYSSAEMNTFVGDNAGNFTLTTGVAEGNTGIGQSVLSGLTTGIANTCVGRNACDLMNTGNSNVGIGYDSLLSATSAGGNSCLGYGTMISTQTGQFNTAIGYQALFNVSSGQANIGLGRATCGSLLTGNFNIAIGNQTGTGWTGAESQNIYLGVINGTNGESNVMRLGNDNSLSSVTTTKSFISGVRGVTTVNNNAIAVLIDSVGQLGTVSSSIRLKENVVSMGNALPQLMELRPVEFNYIGRPVEEVRQGLIAQEVNEVLPGLVATNSEGEIESVKYHELPTLLLKALQEQQKLIERLTARIVLLESL